MPQPVTTPSPGIFRLGHAELGARGARRTCRTPRTSLRRGARRAARARSACRAACCCGDALRAAALARLLPPPLQLVQNLAHRTAPPQFAAAMPSASVIARQAARIDNLPRCQGEAHGQDCRNDDPAAPRRPGARPSLRLALLPTSIRPGGCSRCCFLAPDLSMLGVSRRAADRRRRLQRRPQLGDSSVLLFAVSWFGFGGATFLVLSLAFILGAHIGIDRALGYGLKLRQRLQGHASRADRSSERAIGREALTTGINPLIATQRQRGRGKVREATSHARSFASASSPHCSMFQSSSTCAAAQAASASSAPSASASAISAEPVSVVARLQAGEAKRLVERRERSGDRRKRRLRLRDVHDPLRRARSARQSASPPRRGSDPRPRAAARPAPPARRRGSREDRCRHRRGLARAPPACRDATPSMRRIGEPRHRHRRADRSNSPCPPIPRRSPRRVAACGTTSGFRPGVMRALAVEARARSRLPPPRHLDVACRSASDARGARQPARRLHRVRAFLPSSMLIGLSVRLGGEAPRTGCGSPDKCRPRPEEQRGDADRATPARSEAAAPKATPKSGVRKVKEESSEAG